MHLSWRYPVHAASAASIQQRKALEDEIHAIQERQRRAKRHSRRQHIVEQVAHIDQLVKTLQKEAVREPLSSVRASNTNDPINALPRVAPRSAQMVDDHGSSMQFILTKLKEQNQALQVALGHQAATQSQQSDSEPSTKRVGRSITAQRSLSPSPSLPSFKVDATREPVVTSPHAHHPEYEDENPSIQSSQPEQAAATPKPPPPPQPRISPWEVLENLPEVDWTDDDEQLLDKLLVDGGDDRLDSNFPLPGTTAVVTESPTIDATSSTAGNTIRRPRWRISHDIENGAVVPLVDGTMSAEEPMPLRQVFRSAVIAVLTLVELQRLVLKEKQRLRDKSIQDLKPMLLVYFGATRAWLGKLVKLPLLSTLQDPTLDVNLSIKTGLFDTSTKGLTTWFQRRHRPPQKNASAPTSKVAVTTGDHHAKIVKLKVRVKGVIDAIVKAVEKNDIPNGILDFWRRLTSDGVYFPAMYQLFPSEIQALDLDALGGTRGMQATTTINPASDAGYYSSRSQVVLVNFVLLRILLPHVILRPWEVGLGENGPSSSKAVAMNLKNVATLLYAIISKLSPLPPILSIVAEPSGAGLRLGLRRRSVEVGPTPSAPQASLSSSSSTSPAQEEEQGQANDLKRFLSIHEIHAMLLPDRSFPVHQYQLEPFIDEQHRRLQDALQILQEKLHPPPSAAESKGE